MVSLVRFNEITKLIDGRPLSHLPKFCDITIAGIDEFQEEDKRKLLLPKVIEVVEAYFSETPKSFFLSGCVGCRKTGTMEIVQTYLRYGLYLWEKRLTRPRSKVVAPTGMHDLDWHFHDREKAFNAMIIQRKDLKRIGHEALSKQLKAREINGWVDNSVLSTHTLFIEDFGTGFEDQKGWVLSLQQPFFDNRSEQLSPNFITSNMSPDELKSWPNMSRIVSRVLDDSCTVTYTYGDDAKDRRQNESSLRS